LKILRWVVLLFQTTQTVLSWKDGNDLLQAKNLYKNTRFTLKLLIATPGLEVIHAMTHLVPSNPVIVFVQVFIRFLVVWGITDCFELVGINFLYLNFLLLTSKVIDFINK
jgi:hypothetical protein